MAISSVVITSAEVPVQSPAISQYAGLDDDEERRARSRRSRLRSSRVVIAHLVAQVLLAPVDVGRVGDAPECAMA